LSYRGDRLDRKRFQDTADISSVTMIGPMPPLKIRGRGSGAGSSVLDEMFSQADDSAPNPRIPSINRSLYRASTAVSRGTDDGRIDSQRSPRERDGSYLTKDEPQFKVGTDYDTGEGLMWSRAGETREWDHGKL
jgi:hypothetical protein